MNSLSVLMILSTSPLARSQRISQHKEDIARCAESQELYHPPEDQCFPPLMPGPCQQGSILVLSTTSGLGVCREDPCRDSEEVCSIPGQPRCGRVGERMVWLATGKAECGCEEGWGRPPGDPARCHQESSRGPCPADQILRQRARPCTRLGLYGAMRRWREADRGTGGEEAFMEGVEDLKQLNCGKAGGEECCLLLAGAAGNLELSLYVEDIENGLALFQEPYECGPNETPSGDPCTSGELPWPSQSSSMCFPVSQEVSENRDGCVMHLEGSRIICTFLGNQIELFSFGAGPVARRCRTRWNRYRRRCEKRRG